MNIEAIKDFCGEKMAEGVTQAELSDLLSEKVKKDPKNWTVGSDPSWGVSKTGYYMRKWGLLEVKPRKDPDFIDVPIKPAQTTYVMVMVPQDRLQNVLGVL